MEDSGEGGRKVEFPLTYFKPCVWCLNLGYLMGCFRIWKSLLGPARPPGGGFRGMAIICYFDLEPERVFLIQTPWGRKGIEMKT